MKTPREKYMTDNHYKALVNVMLTQIEGAQFTPSEIREAAILASIMYEEAHVSHIDIINPGIERAFGSLYKWLNTPAPHNVSINRDKK